MCNPCHFLINTVSLFSFLVLILFHGTFLSCQISNWNFIFSPHSPIDIHSPVVQSTNMPLLSHSNDELKNTMVLCKSTVAVPLQEKVEIPLKVSLEALPEVSVEAALKGSMDAAPEVSVEAAPEASVEVHPEVRVEAPFKVSMEAAPAVIMGAFPEMSVEPLLENLETSPEGSEDMSLMSVDPSPEVSMDSSSEVSLDSYPEVSMETTSEARMEVFHKVNMEMIPEESLETVLEENIEVPPKASVGASPESKSCPEVNVRDTPQVCQVPLLTDLLKICFFNCVDDLISQVSQ